MLASLWARFSGVPGRLFHFFPRFRPIVRIVIIVLVVAGFTYYLHAHPELGRQLLKTPVTVLVALLLLYFAWFAALVLTVYGTLRLCRQPLPLREHVLVNAYSTLVNFFVPGQGGVVFRGLYLKKRYGLPVRTYIFGSLVYYAFYAVVSAFMMLVVVIPAGLTVLGVLAVATFSTLVLRWYLRRSGNSRPMLEFSVFNLTVMLLVTLLQALVQVLIYGVELHAIDPGVSWAQAITYTGVANFSLFVALTPGAIGIREAFLLFGERLHHVATSAVVAAALMDRAVFIVLLGLLFVLTLVMHARKRLQVE